jgi:RNA polymerase sigma-70 factor (ECF subfamily)
MADPVALHWQVPTLSSEEEACARAFEAALPECTTLAFRIAYSVLRHREDAEDVAQEVLAKAFRSLFSLRDPDRLRPWIARSAFRHALNRRRAARRRSSWEEAAATESSKTDGGNGPEAVANQERVFRAIDGLPEKLRLVLLLSALEGHGHREVAMLLGLPEGTVKSRLHLARRALAERLR